MLFEIINPSDAYTIEAPDLKIAACACIALGNGQYAFNQLDGSEEVPLFLCGGHDEYFTEKFGADLTATLDSVLAIRREELAACLDSVLIGSAADRAEVNEFTRDMPAEKRRELILKRHDKRRSSLNDIGTRAYNIAAALRKPQPADA